MMPEQPAESQIDKSFPAEPVASAASGGQTGGEVAGSSGQGQDMADLKASPHHGQVINYYFPIEVSMVGTLSDAEVQRVARYVYNELTAALQRQAPQVE